MHLQLTPLVDILYLFPQLGETLWALSTTHDGLPASAAGVGDMSTNSDELIASDHLFDQLIAGLGFLTYLPDRSIGMLLHVLDHQFF